MKYIFKAIFIVLAAIIGFTWIAIAHVLNIIWELKLNPKTSWNDGYGVKCKGNFTQRYKAWQKIIETSTVFEIATTNIDL
jgi:hypothetical protein